MTKQLAAAGEIARVTGDLTARGGVLQGTVRPSVWMSLAMEFGHATVGFRNDCIPRIGEVFADDRVERGLSIFAHPQMTKLAVRWPGLTVQVIPNSRSYNVSDIPVVVGYDLSQVRNRLRVEPYGSLVR